MTYSSFLINSPNLHIKLKSMVENSPEFLQHVDRYEPVMRELTNQVALSRLDTALCYTVQKAYLTNRSVATIKLKNPAFEERFVSDVFQIKLEEIDTIERGVVECFQRLSIHNYQRSDAGWIDHIRMTPESFTELKISIMNPTVPNLYGNVDQFLASDGVQTFIHHATIYSSSPLDAGVYTQLISFFEISNAISTVALHPLVLQTLPVIVFAQMLRGFHAYEGAYVKILEKISVAISNKFRGFQTKMQIFVKYRPALLKFRLGIFSPLAIGSIISKYWEQYWSPAKSTFESANNWTPRIPFVFSGPYAIPAIPEIPVDEEIPPIV